MTTKPRKLELTAEQKSGSVQEFNLVKGLTIAVISGILSSFFNFGIEAGKPMAAEAVAQGFNPLFQNNVTYIVLLWGGLTTNLVWCVYLMWKNETFGSTGVSGRSISDEAPFPFFISSSPLFSANVQSGP